MLHRVLDARLFLCVSKQAFGRPEAHLHDKMERPGADLGVRMDEHACALLADVHIRS
jgi:hypothetical protein